MKKKQLAALIMFLLTAGCGDTVDTGAPTTPPQTYTFIDGKADNIYDCPECSFGTGCVGDVEVTYAVDCTAASCEVHAEERRDCAVEGLVCDDGACADPNAQNPVKRVFVTDLKYDGNLAFAAGIEDGLAAGDALCQLEADRAELGGQWKAWLSDDDNSAFERIEDVGPWYLLHDQTLVAYTLREMLTQGPQHSIEKTPTGQRRFDVRVWTGTSEDGSGTPHSCSNWTSSEAKGTTGRTTTTPGLWTTWNESISCRDRRPLYCFEQ